MHQMPSAYFELEKVIELKQFSVNFEKNMKILHQSTLALVDDTKITSAGVIIRT